MEVLYVISILFHVFTYYKIPVHSVCQSVCIHKSFPSLKSVVYVCEWTSSSKKQDYSDGANHTLFLNIPLALSSSHVNNVFTISELVWRRKGNGEGKIIDLTLEAANPCVIWGQMEEEQPQSV